MNRSETLRSNPAPVQIPERIPLDDDRILEISEALEGKIRPGEELIIRCDGEEIKVFTTEPLAKTNPELYGSLRQIDAAIRDAGNTLLWIAFALAGVLCLSVHLRWFDQFLGMDVDKLSSGWLYAMVFFVALAVAWEIAMILERSVYRKRKPQLVWVIERHRLTPHRLLTLIEDSENLRKVAKHLKRDRDDDRCL